MASPLDKAFPTQQQAPSTTNEDNLSPLERAYPTLGGNIPSTEQTAENQARARAAQAAAQRFEELPWHRRTAARLSNVARGIPVVRSAFDPNNPDVAELQTGFPRAAAFERGVGHAIPYTAVGAGLPALMSTLPRAAIVGGITEGGSAAVEGEPIAPAAVSGVASAVPGALLGKMITPRPEFPTGFRLGYDTRARGPVTGRPIGEDTRTHIGVQSRAQIGRRASRDASDLAMGETVEGLNAATQPSRPLSLGITNRPLLENPIAGAVVSSLLGAHPAIGAGAMLAPELGRRGIRSVLAAERRGALGGELMPELAGRRLSPLDRGIHGWLNNTAIPPLSDRMRALLHALSVPAAVEGTDTLSGQ